MINSKAKSTVLRICIIVGLGGLLFGMDQGFINGSLNLIREDMHLSLAQGESYASIMLIGCIVGIIISGWLSRVSGRKFTLLMAAVFFVVFTLTGAVTHNIYILFASRFALGLAVGCASFIVPLYLSETAPSKIRGRAIAMYSLMTTIGVFLVFLSNSVIGAYFHNWRLMLGVLSIPALILFLGALTIPRSPRWLLLKNKDNEAEGVLKLIRENEKNVKCELDEIRLSIADDKNQSGWKIIKKPYYVKVLVLGIALMFLQQFSGINAIIYYSTNIFTMAGISNPTVVTVVMGLINVCLTVVALKYVDKWGRKPILYAGLSIMIVTLLIIGVLFRFEETGTVLNSLFKLIMLISCLSYVASFAVSLGPIMGLLVAEIFPLEGRDFGMAVSMITCWVGCTIVVSLSLTVIDVLGGSVLFFIFAFCCILGIGLVKYFTPETKGVSLEFIEMNLKNGKKLKDMGR
jgi:MFS transporter, SP family, galactose:H+ symporter